MITYFFRSIKDAALLTFPDPRPGVWVYVENPTKGELEQISNDFLLDPAIVTDALDFFEVPRFERSGVVSYFFTRYPYLEEGGEIDTAPLLIAIGESAVVTIALRAVPFLEELRSDSGTIYTTQKTKLLLDMVTALLESYNRELLKINREVNKTKGKIRSVRTRTIEQLVHHENSLNDIVAALVPTNTWLSHLLSGNYLQLFKEDIALGEDLAITGNQLVDSAKSILKTIQNIRGAYESILTNNLNMTIRMLAALTIVLTIPTTITSLYGMNVSLPLQNNQYVFWFIVVFIGVLMTSVVYFFSRNRWL